MIERYSIGCDLHELQARFNVAVPEAYSPRFNAAPGQLLPVILLQSKGLSFFYWGESPQWIKNKPISEKLINVRAEQIAERPLLQKMLRRKRCLIPADGFYAWKRSGKKGLIPYRFTLKTRSTFSIPGFWEEYENEGDNVIHTFTIITRVCTHHREVSERIPIIFEKPQEQVWMDTECTNEKLIELLNEDSKESFDFYTISTRINQLEVDDASLIKSAPAADQFGNLTLFD